MGRALRIGAVLLVATALVLVGIEVGMFIRMNDAWVTLRWPLPRGAAGAVGVLEYESPAWVLCLGWIVAAIFAVVTVLWFPVYLTRRRQARTEIARLEREVADLRNLPIKAPAPLADLPPPDGEGKEQALEPEIGAEE
ncbi:MAG: hypothetical protein HY906_17380 [Deltaproteobacteria bacterium]|nr:hypothetical protein [Deltaproteobacteria bacterium]